MNRNIIFMTYLLLAAVIAVLLLLLLENGRDTGNTEYEVLHDTIVRTIKPDPIVITKVRTKIIKLKDTVIAFHPFRAVVDTVIKWDTIHSYFEFPSGMFSLEYLPAADTLSFSKTVYCKTAKRKEKWWEKPLMIMGGVLAGYTIGRVR